MTPDMLADACGQLASYMEMLEDLLPEQARDGGAPARAPSGRAVSPEPWNGEAGRALMTAHEGVRRLEASLRVQVAGGPGARRGGSDANTARALAAIPKLAAGLLEDDVRLAADIIGGWIALARQVGGIDETRRWRPLPRRPGDRLPPRCPYCETYQLRVDVAARVVACFFPGCADRNGITPVGVLETGPDGRPRISWADGLTEMAPDPPPGG